MTQITTRALNLGCGAKGCDTLIRLLASHGSNPYATVAHLCCGAGYRARLLGQPFWILVVPFVHLGRSAFATGLLGLRFQPVK
jgi:hypothetical protein